MVAHPHLTVSGRRALVLLPCCPVALLGLRREERVLPAENELVAPGQRSLSETLDLTSTLSQIPIAQLPSAGLHRVQGIPENCSPCYTRVSLLLIDSRSKIHT